METITRLLELAKKGTLDGDAVLSSLVDSEGNQGSVHVSSLGHPLQHVARLTSAPGGFQSLKSDYHRRGPMRFTTESGFKAQHIKSHSQFQDEQEAAEAVAAALSTAAGQRALEVLKQPKFTVSLESPLPSGVHLARSAQILADPTGPQANYNFVMFDAVETQGIQLELHRSRKITDGLHIQSAYPLTTPTQGGGVLVITEWPSKMKQTETF